MLRPRPRSAPIRRRSRQQRTAGWDRVARAGARLRRQAANLQATYGSISVGTMHSPFTLHARPQPGAPSTKSTGTVALSVSAGRSSGQRPPAEPKVEAKCGNEGAGLTFGVCKISAFSRCFWSVLGNLWRLPTGGSGGAGTKPRPRSVAASSTRAV
jgi:hypothetical protein